MNARTILHVDMNAFFASVEQQADPRLQGKPVAVAGKASRTVILTASYEARAFGVKTGMRVFEARQKCPDLILVAADNRKYTWTARGITTILREFTPLVEVFSIDEAFLDITGSLVLFGGAERIAYLIKARIRHRFGITCSIGIAPNKLLAKLASEMKKPDGLVIIQPEAVSAILEGVPVSDLCGIGAKTARQLTLYGIRTCGDLGRFPVAMLEKRFGIIGQRLHQMGLGRDDTPVVPAEEAEDIKSVGHSMTLEHDLAEQRDILRQLLRLSEMVGRRARAYGVEGRTVTLTVRYDDFTTFFRQATRSHPTNRSDEIYQTATGILNTLDLSRPVRLLGVRINNLRHHAEQLPLFPEELRKDRATSAMDRVNALYGECTVTFATLVGESGNSQVISPAWRPEGVRQGDVE